MTSVSPRTWAAVAFGGLLIALAVVVITRVPWSVSPAPRADQLAALQSLPADEVARGRAFHSALRPGIYGGLGAGLLIAVILGLTPLGARLVELAGRPFGGHWLAQTVLGGLAVVFAGELVTLPFAAWRQRVVRDYGLSTQTWGAWAVDLLKAYAIGAVIGTVALVGFFTIAKLFPRWWFAVGAVGAAGLMVLLTFVFPVLVEPVFNKFTPMEPGQLRTDLQAMAQSSGVPVRDVLVADASRRTRAVNAYVSGFGPTRRIVVYDTLLKEAPSREVRAVVAHELSHAREGDVVTGTLISALGAALAVCGLYLLGSWGGLLRRAGVESIAQPRAVALLVAISLLVGLLTAPAQAFVSRKMEARSDEYALVLTGEESIFEEMMARLAKVNLADPDPPWIERILFGSHPSTVERMAMARAHGRGR